MKINRVAITGASGFIGAYLCRALVKNGYFVNAIDNNLRGDSNRLNGIQNLKLFEIDVRDKNGLKKAFKNCSTIFHLAAINGTENFYNKPDLVLDVGIKGMFAVSEAAIEEGVENLIVASSAEVYQTPKIIPTPENIELILPNSINPRYSYGGSKIISELISMNIGKEHFKKVQIFRPHNIYGPDMGWKHVIPEFLNQIQSQIEKTNDKIVTIQVKGNENETRSFCYVDDAVRGILTMVRHGSHREIYHIGNDRETTIKELIELISRQIGVKVIISNIANMEGSTARRCPDLKKIKNLGYSPRINLEVGLKKTIKWYFDNPKQKSISELI